MISTVDIKKQLNPVMKNLTELCFSADEPVVALPH